MSHPSLDEVLTCPTLPSLPAVAMQVIDLTGDPDVHLPQLAQVIQNDQALSSKILKTVNSSYYGLSKPCPTISRALAYLGLSTVKSLALGFSLIDVTKKSSAGLDITDYWRRCLYTAATARQIGMTLKICDPEEIFLSALMQDIGMLALHHSMGSSYGELIQSTDGMHGKLAKAEMNTFGFDHAFTGAELGLKWRFPESLVTPIRFHHTYKPSSSEHESMIKVILLANEVAGTIDTMNQPGLDKLYRSAGKFFQLPHAEVKSLITQSIDDAVDLAKLMGVTIGAPPPAINDILAQAEDAKIMHQIQMEQQALNLRQQNTELTQQTVTDALTQVGNRKHFDATLQQHFDNVSHIGSVGVILSDVDKFKSFNDTLGHQAGDEVLIELAARMSETVGDAGTVCRYGGEEFAVIVPGGNRKQTAQLAEKIRQNIAASPFDLRKVECPCDERKVTASFGVAVFDSATQSVISNPKFLVKAADRALYAAKDAGRNCVRVFTPKRKKATAAAK